MLPCGPMPCRHRYAVSHRRPNFRGWAQRLSSCTTAYSCQLSRVRNRYRRLLHLSTFLCFAALLLVLQRCHMGRRARQPKSACANRAMAVPQVKAPADCVRLQAFHPEAQWKTASPVHLATQAGQVQKQLRSAWQSHSPAQLVKWHCWGWCRLHNVSVYLAMEVRFALDSLLEVDGFFPGPP